VGPDPVDLMLESGEGLASQLRADRTGYNDNGTKRKGIGSRHA